jgi:hypothetical protein
MSLTSAQLCHPVGGPRCIIALARSWRVCLAVLLSCHAARTRRTSVWLWAGGFAATALAACSGGIYHGLLDTLESVPGLILWKTTVLAVGLAGGLLLCGCLQSTVGAPARHRLLGGVEAKLAVFVLWMSVHNDFG